MTNKEIEQAEKELSEIEKNMGNPKGTIDVKPIDNFLEKHGIHKAPMPGSGATRAEWREQTFRNAHTFLQTKMMLNACNFSKSACKWAAIAAIVAAIGVLASWHTYLFKMIIQIFNGI
ncbi:hypothetical protein H8E88_00950 [candidate division KSB1 bacterium]|nr:hypothetical protein [candidate division KSB1 bacterium]